MIVGSKASRNRRSWLASTMAPAWCSSATRALRSPRGRDCWSARRARARCTRSWRASAANTARVRSPGDSELRAAVDVVGAEREFRQELRAPHRRGFPTPRRMLRAGTEVTAERRPAPCGELAENDARTDPTAAGGERQLPEQRVEQRRLAGTVASLRTATPVAVAELEVDGAEPEAVPLDDCSARASRRHRPRGEWVRARGGVAKATTASPLARRLESLFLERLSDVLRLLFCGPGRSRAPPLAHLLLLFFDARSLVHVVGVGVLVPLAGQPPLVLRRPSTSRVLPQPSCLRPPAR